MLRKSRNHPATMRLTTMVLAASALTAASLSPVPTPEASSKEDGGLLMFSMASIVVPTPAFSVPEAQWTTSHTLGGLTFTPEPVPEPEPEPEPVEAAEEEEVAAAALSTELIDAQNLLMEMGYDLPRFGADGIWGEETAVAVRELADNLGADAPGEQGAYQLVREASRAGHSRPAPAPAPTPEPAPAPTPTRTATPLEAPQAERPRSEQPSQDAGGSSVREQVLSTARQHIGTPYVWGGNSAGGLDCSGFTQLVFRQLGVELPRTTGDQRNAGRQVSASEALPGDLVWWPGHIGIYTGSGQHIAARNPSTPLHEGPLPSGATFIRVVD